jgi:hypothetical protein
MEGLKGLNNTGSSRKLSDRHASGFIYNIIYKEIKSGDLEVKVD